MPGGPDWPSGLDLDALPGPDRNGPACLYIRDLVFWNADRSAFLLAYTMREASMMNEVAKVFIGAIGGTVRDGGLRTVWNSEENLYACYWDAGCIAWRDKGHVAFKTYLYTHDEAPGSRRVDGPILVMDMEGRSGLVPGSNTAGSRASDPFDIPELRCRSDAALLREIRESG